MVMAFDLEAMCVVRVPFGAVYKGAVLYWGT